MEKMVTGLGDSSTFSGDTLLTRILDSDDSFSYFEAGMAADALEESNSM